MKTPPHRKPYYQKIRDGVDQLLAVELEAVRSELLKLVKSPQVSLLEFFKSAIAYWQAGLQIDRIFVCDMRTGDVVEGWNKGKNLVRLSDWDGDYVPFEDDATLQKALASDELIADPVPGQGVDLAFTVNCGDFVYLVAFDQTDTARRFSPLDMAQLGLVRDLLQIKASLIL
ncbi:MAG: hypothetical protein H6510_01315 [Acidobacteria bacterium]|nr:hypothetical protein [Acidobacteriota bacterium]MCB9396429.1 hypothetical protein [Acidobacteriota bacterium]